MAVAERLDELDASAAAKPRSGSATRRAERRTSTKRAVEIALVAIALGVVALEVLLAFGLGGFDRDSLLSLLPAAALLALCLFCLLYLRGLLGSHFAALDRLRGAVVTMADDQNAVVPQLRPGEGGLEIERLHGAMAALSAREAQDRTAPDLRLQAVLATICEAILVVTDQAQVSLVNYPAKQLLGAEQMKVGKSAFSVFERESLLAALAAAERAEGPMDVSLETIAGRQLSARIAGLGEHGGAVISFPAEPLEHRAELECDLALHDLPPPAQAITDDTPLDALPVLVMDTETTGLDVTDDRIVSIGAVRLQGARIYRGASFDRLVNPERPIPPRSTAVHGITDEMVAESALFPAVYGDFQPLAAGTAIVGHNIPYDLAMLRRECVLAGLDWREPPWLDTLVLVAALDPQLLDLDLEGLAARFGVDVHGRHTALGDCLVTAEIYARLIPQLRDHGIATYGEARAFSQKAKHIIKRQRQAGW